MIKRETKHTRDLLASSVQQWLMSKEDNSFLIHYSKNVYKKSTRLQEIRLATNIHQE
jgi:hypothetical protein